MKQKIYDCFLFRNELELLELRMEILGPYVDYFLLLESPYSFPGLKKELTFEKNKHKFDTSKIKHCICETLPYIGNVDEKRHRGKTNEYFSRNYMTTCLKSADPDDIIILSDIDEIPNPEVFMDCLHILDDENLLENKNCKYLGTQMHLFYYYMNYLTNKEWHGSIICKLKNFNKPSKMRRNRGVNVIKNCGWHYSYLGGVKKIQSKVKNLGSVQFNKEIYINEYNLEKCLKNGKDLYGRSNMKCKIVDPIMYGPKIIDSFIKKYPQFVRN